MDKFLYFIIHYSSNKNEVISDINFIVPENTELHPQCVYSKENYNKKTYYYTQVFKLDKSFRKSEKGKKSDNYYFEFELGDNKYYICFDSKGSTFVYDVSLEFGKKRLTLRRKINQTLVEYNEKMDIFEKALKENKEENQLNSLYNETINLYTKKKSFSLLITIFLKIYKNKDICPTLLKVFKNMNLDPKEKGKNNDRKPYLKDYTSFFKEITEEADLLINKNNYDIIEYYGIILCYLNYYDKKLFEKIIDDLAEKNSNVLYEILIIYTTHFKYPINKNYQFFNKFTEYTILNKDFSAFLICLDYIKDLETYINVIEGTKQYFYEKYHKSDDRQKNEKHIIKIDKSLKLKKNVDLVNPVIIDKGDEICTTNKNKKSVEQIKKEKDEKVEKKNENKNILNIIKKIDSIIKYSRDKKIFLIYFTNDFWKYLLSINNEPNQDNIYFCSKIRDTFHKYYELVINIFEKKTNFTIKKEAINYYERDEFAFILDQMIKQLISTDNDLTNIEKLAYITQYNPYYNEEKYYSKVDAEIFNNFDLNNIDQDFIEDFRKMNFEIIFKESINEYIDKIVAKVKSIFNFETVIELINIKNITDKKIFLEAYNRKYDTIIKPEIGLLTGENLNEAINVTAKIALINFIYETEEKDDKEEKSKKDENKFKFINNKIKRLNKELIPLIFIEIIKICIEKENKIKKEENEEIEEIDKKEDNSIFNQEDSNIDFKEMKDYIFDEFTSKLDNVNNIDNIIVLLNCLEGNSQKKEEEKKEENDDKAEENEKKVEKEKIINEFLQKLMDNNLITKEDFFSNQQNPKILLLCKLYEAGKIKKNAEKYYQDIEEKLEDIKIDILDGYIQKRKLDEFLKNEESIILQRLKLIKIIYDTFNPQVEYPKIKKHNEEINQYINKLNYIKENIIIYYKETYQQQIKHLIDIIKDNKNKRIIDYKGAKLKDPLIDNAKLEEKANEINKLKHFLLFNIIYEMNATKDEDYSFNLAVKKLDDIGNILTENNGLINLYRSDKGDKEDKKQQILEIFEKIKEKISNSEERAQKFIQDFLDYYNIKDEHLIDELTILFKSKKYELDINSMIFFFDYFEKDNESWKKKLSKEVYENLSSLTDFSEMKDKLLELKNNGIYDYKNIKNYNKLFTCLYQKKEAIEFLFSKTCDEIEKLIGRIQPTDRTISIKDVNDTKECIYEITKMKKNIKHNDKIFSYIQSMSENTIKQFVNYSKVYESVIELDGNEEDSTNIYEKVISIINDASFNIFQDSESFIYKKDNKNYNISKDDLVHLKNRIHLKNEKENDENIGEDTLKRKRKILIFYKKIISNLEIIIEYMDVLRNKGSSLPIRINMEIKVEKNEPSIIYRLEKDKVTFDSLRKFLFDAKTSYISQLDSMYKEKLNLRFLYGKQFRSVMKHLKSNLNLDSFLRYILNCRDNNIKIKEGYKAEEKKVNDYVTQYEMYNKDSFDNISEYITTLFKNNNKTPEEHYNKIRIISSDKGSVANDKESIINDKDIIHFYKGIYQYQCDNTSMEESIINLFWDKTGELPIAQNVLITNKETSIEEIQAFFHRAILCNYNTLFVVEINDSFSDYQQSKMNNYIDTLLSNKNRRYNERTGKNIDKKKTHYYLDSCIVFIYDKNNKNILSFLKELGKFDAKNIKDDKINKIRYFDNDKKNDDFINELGNVLVVTSEICGLGKSEKIKEITKNKKYFHFPLGGILTKKVIFDKLEELLEKIKNENFKEVAIHLDLTESKEKSIINEFLFSFLVTKFYSNNENILYIPKDISIYIEIPNCFDDYLKKFDILNIFPRENITFENMPAFNYPEETIKIFSRMLEINSNIEIQNFVKKYIDIPRYSYHQINIFIKLFISQYSKFDSKIYFYSNGKNVTEERISQFALCTKYFTNGGFAQLLTGIDENSKKDIDYIDKLSAIYDNDLHRDFPTPLIFIIKEKMIYNRLYIPTKETNEYNCSIDYLKRIKEILNLRNELETDKEIKGKKYKSLLSIIEKDDYVITNDNFKKMVLLVYRIKANVPVIIMGDTGCGKTALITKLNQILNNGETTVEIINIHPGITDEKLYEIMKEKNEKAEKLMEEYKEKKEKMEKNESTEEKDEIEEPELWIFFDEMNTCLSMSLLTEIFINRAYNGNKLCKNIRRIGACNPYRKRKENKEKCGLSKSDDNDNELVYIVEPLPQSLLYYIFSFGSIDDDDEKKYIHSIIKKLFTEEEIILHDLTRDAISQCHIYLRNTFDPSVVSLREIARFAKCIDFFNKYFNIKNNYLGKVNDEKINKIRSIICSIYLCYYIRLTDEKKRSNFEGNLRPILLKLINNDKNFTEKGGNLLEQIKNEKLIQEILKYNETLNKLSDFLRIEQEFILDQIELDKGIGKNTLLLENVFLLFLSVVTNIPLIIIGKPGTGKSLSAQLIYKSMRGKYSKNKFFQLFPKIIQIYFQGSKSSEPEDVEYLFDKAKLKLKHFIKENDKLIQKGQKPEKLPIIMVLFDELGLAERSKKNPLKVLHSKLEYSGKDEGVSFVGISNYSLDAAKVNRALVLSVPDLDQRLDEIIKTSNNIVESISERLAKDPIFALLSRTYFDYKNELQFIKELIVFKKYKNNKDIKLKEQIEKRQFGDIKKENEFIALLKKENKIRKDFHGNRDFYNLIKGIAIELGKLGAIDNIEKVPIIIKYIERNFGGIEYEIDIDFNSTNDDIMKSIKAFKKIIEDYELYKENEIILLNSVFLFKQLYNSQFEKDPNNSLKIETTKINDYNLNSCINSNIRDFHSRYLLLQVSPTLTTLIYQNIKLQNQLIDIELYDGSPFIDDNNKEYRFKKINQIQDDARFEKLIVLENLNQIHPFLFDLYNRNYIIKDEEKKFVRICLENDNEQLTLVDDKFRIIILFDRAYINKCELAFLNRLEKMILSFDKLLDNRLKTIANKLIGDLRFENIIQKYTSINYSLKDLLINCQNEDIQGLIYYFSKESKKQDKEIDNEEIKEENIDETSLRDKVLDKLYKVLPQDIICILPDNNLIKMKYNELKNINNFEEYLQKEYRNKDESSKYKISIIYTYTSITNVVVGQNKGNRFMISEIRSEDGLKNLIEEIQKKNELNKLKKDYYICIHFQSSNSKIIKFVSNFILNTFKNDNYMYIFIVHISRNINGKNNERVYSLPDINPSIYQIFIDDLNCNNYIRLNDLLTQDIKTVLKEKKKELKLDEEFKNILTNFLKKELSERLLYDEENNEYIDYIENYLDQNEEMRNKIMEKAFKLIDEAKTEEVNCNDIIKKMYKTNYISKFTLDIATCLINYIKDNIFKEYLERVFKILEDNNILTTLFENVKSKFKFIGESIVEKIIIKYLDLVEKKDNYDSKFLFNYNIPGFYHFYQNISEYISKNIKINYFNNEKKLRELLKEDIDKIKDFYDKEESLLSAVYDEISAHHKFIIDIIDKIPEDIILKDYITFYLQKYKNKDDFYDKNDKYHQILEILLKLRFNEEKKIIKNNKENKINLLLIKIMWVESNINYILDIFKIFEKAVLIFNDDHNKLIKNMEGLIFGKENLKYIMNNTKNPAHTKEVNECYYILLASICYSITDEVNLYDGITKKNNNESGIEINYYCYLLEEINRNLFKLNDDLYIYLNEMYIIDELIKIIELFKNVCNIEIIDKFKNNIRENAKIIQKYSDEINDDSSELSKELTENFDSLNNLINENSKKVKRDKNFYDKIRYIFFKEIKKISDINYRQNILGKILEENEMIKKSKDIFQILLKNYLKTDDKFIDNRDKIVNGNDIIIKDIEKKLECNNYILSETILNLFEKNSMIYLTNILKDKKDKKGKKIEINLEDEPLEVLKKCIEFLNYYIFKPNLLVAKMKETAKLFCLAFIKVYNYLFIKMFKEEKPKFKDYKKILNVLNGKDTICKMIRIYIYKILYNKYKIDVFIDKESIEKFKLKEYIDFNKLVDKNELINIYKIDYKIKTLNDNCYKEAYSAIEKYKNKNFEKAISKDDFDLKDYGIDNFYVVTFNMVLSDLQSDYAQGSINFYNNICKPLFEKDEKNILLFNTIQLFYNPSSYKEIKTTYRINSNNIKPILFGYRICLNEIYNKFSRGIYYPLYDSKNLNYLKDKLYPGNDTRFNLAYYEIINHFKVKPEEGCYVCLCENSYYHSVPSGFPGIGQLNMKCPKCKKNIGAIQRGKDIICVKRDGYYRILKDKEQKKKIKENKLKEINCITLDEFREKYIYNSYDKGIYICDKNSFLNDMKIIRNLSQISYRILNYILYVNLFFARIITNKNEFDKYLPRDMKWAEILSECWNLIKNELLKEDIYSIEEFMNYLFVNLFPILNQKKCIDQYKELIQIEGELESEIQKIIKDYKETGCKIDSNQKGNEDDKTKFIYLLKEKYSKNDYLVNDFPFYEYFYYTDYLDEEYINKKLEHMYEKKYPVLKKYLENQESSNKNEDKLSYLSLFNTVLNLINEKYFNKISRDFAKKNMLKDTEIYMNNAELIDKFIEFYNSLNIKDDKKNKIKLGINNFLCDFFIDDNNCIGRSYKAIYKDFVKVQNDKLEPLIDIKIEKLIFDINSKSKINIQQIDEREIFTLKIPKKVSFIDILFNSSYRKILDSDSLNNESYNEYEINYNMLEENMTEYLLKNKKLLNEEITEFVYNNEVFSVQLTGFTTLFNLRYLCKEIGINEKVTIYKFTDENKNNNNLSQNIINDFIILIKYLNDKRREKNQEFDIKEESKLSEVINKNLKESVSDNFIKIFENNDGMTVDKTLSIFDYYLKTISKSIIAEINDYQEKELNNDSIASIENYYKKNDPLISKKDFSIAIRLFTSLVLFQEKEKKKKIGLNHNNLVNYLKVSDLWSKDIYENQDFNKNLNELKLCNIAINQTIALYELIGQDFEDNYFNDVIQRIENEKAETKVEDDPFGKNPEDPEDPFGNGGDNTDEDDDGIRD